MAHSASSWKWPFPRTIACAGLATACPVRAISTYDFMADSQTCISCMRCMRDCPAHARKVNGLMVKIASAVIAKECNVRKEAELFL
ncbi:4Fe-4S dicluster domain-containing protein [Slackia isoflavoniconvertens]|uniref:4Fe-4S dicluster domain-containing protein n=1 Tax=Slackia isoflavoniconvertens TaxID=572010 RepID=UPI003AB6CE43